MDDITFLKDCGIEVDTLWLADLMVTESPEPVQNYINDLLRIANLIA